MRLQSLELRQISIEDPFWSQHVDLVRKAIIPYQWEAMNDRIPESRPAGRKESFTGRYFRIRTLPNGWRQWDLP